MTRQDLIIAKLKSMSMDTVNAAVLDLMSSHDKKRINRLMDYYDGKHRILDRKGDGDKPNNRLVNDYPGEIVDTATGYFIGIPIAYKSDDERYRDVVNRIRTINDEELHNEALVTEMCVVGRSYELLYLDEDGEIRFMRIPATEIIPVYDGSIQNRMQMAVRYYPIQINGQDATKVEVYDDEKVTYYILQFDRLYLDDTEPENPFVHHFGKVPVVEYKNNKAALGDFEKVLTLIDEYNRHLSDISNEHEYFRNAYLMLRNLSETTSEDLKEIRQLGAFKVNDDGDVKFVVKDINDEAVEHHFERLDENIHKFSKTPDLTDESFAGNLSGVAIKYKIMELETKYITKERHMLAGLRRRWELVTNILNIKGNNFDYHDLRFEFRRNLPSNIREEADIVTSLFGRVSKETLYGLLSFIDDPQAEIERMEKEENDIDLEVLLGAMEEVDVG